MQQEEHCHRKTIWTTVGWLCAVVVVVGVYTAAIMFARWEKDHAPPLPVPIVCLTRPDNNATGVLPNASVVADIYLPNFGSGVSTITMNTRNVKLLKIEGSKETEVAGHANTSGAGDSIVFTPTDMLDPGGQYKFRVNGVRDTSGAMFTPYEMSFTVAAKTALSTCPVAFEHVQLPYKTIFTGLTVGPDHRLYTGTFDGRILRFDFLPDGTLSEPYVISTVIDANRGTDSPTGNRLITGICFDPASTADNMVLWITHGVCAIEHCPDWSSKLSRLSGPDFNHYEDYVVGLPRAWRDHLSFKIQFGPDGGLYFNQGSSSSTVRRIISGACAMNIC